MTIGLEGGYLMLFGGGGLSGGYSSGGRVKRSAYGRGSSRGMSIEVAEGGRDEYWRSMVCRCRRYWRVDND